MLAGVRRPCRWRARAARGSAAGSGPPASSAGRSGARSALAERGRPAQRARLRTATCWRPRRGSPLRPARAPAVRTRFAAASRRCSATAALACATFFLWTTSRASVALSVSNMLLCRLISVSTVFIWRGDLGGVLRVEHHREAHQRRVAVWIVRWRRAGRWRLAARFTAASTVAQVLLRLGELRLAPAPAGLHLGVELLRRSQLTLGDGEAALRGDQAGAGGLQPVGGRATSAALASSRSLETALSSAGPSFFLLCRSSAWASGTAGPEATTRVQSTASSARDATAPRRTAAACGEGCTDQPVQIGEEVNGLDRNRRTSDFEVFAGHHECRDQREQDAEHRDAADGE